MTNQSLNFVFFGGEPLGVPVLEELKAAGFIPSLIVCNPDRPAGRGQRLQQPPVKVWAEEHQIPVYQPTHFEKYEMTPLTATLWDLFVVVAYNKILPAWLIELPTHKTINVHPSLLPKLRGASPIRSAILRDEREHIGVSIMRMDAKMDHGPLIAQEKMDIADQYWPLAGPQLDTGLARHGGALLAAVLPEYITGARELCEQDHERATYCGRLEKSMAEVSLDPYQLPAGEMAKQILHTIRAFEGLGDAWFMHNDIRYKITAAHLADDQLYIDAVIPAGKKETAFKQIFT